MKKNILEKIIIIVLAITFILDFFFNQINNYYLEPFVNIIYILLATLLIYLGNINKVKEEKKKSFKLIFIFYIILIVYLTFNRFWHYRDGMYNLIPFNTIMNLRGNTHLLRTLIFNFFLYMPLAIILPNMTDKLKKTKNYIITIIFISICVKGIGYILHYSVLDIDDIILNISGSIILFIIIKNKKINKYINDIIYNKKINENIHSIIYISIYAIFIGISVIKSSGGIMTLYDAYYRDFSHFTCYKNEKTYIATIGNEKYYSKCEYKDSYIIAGNTKYSVPDYVQSWQYRERDNSKLYIIKEKIIDNIKITKKDNTIKKIYSYYDSKKLYMVDIDYITLTKNGIEYKIEDEQENDINFDTLVKLYSIKEHEKYSYVIYKGDDFNTIHIFFGNNEFYAFIVPKNYIINDSNITKLYEFAKNNNWNF